VHNNELKLLDSLQKDFAAQVFELTEEHKSIVHCRPRMFRLRHPDWVYLVGSAYPAVPLRQFEACLADVLSIRSAAEATK
jgi:hypothetical protein